MQTGRILQEGDAAADGLVELDVDVGALLDAAGEVGLVEVGEGEAGVGEGAAELIAIGGGGGGSVEGVVDGGAAEGGDLGADGERWGRTGAGTAGGVVRWWERSGDGER